LLTARLALIRNFHTASPHVLGFETHHLNNPLGGWTPPYRLRGLGRHASRLCRPGHHRGYEVSVTRVAND